MKSVHKKAFTMIELIFVIVVIGILGAIAIPKLAATRDDAYVSVAVNNTTKLLQDIQSYYTANGEIQYLSARTPDISNVPLFLNTSCRTRATRAQRIFVGSTLYLCVDNIPVLKITTTNLGARRQLVTFSQRISSTTLSRALSRNNLFQQLTNGTVGLTTNITGANVNY